MNFLFFQLKKPDEDAESGIEELSKARNEKYKTLSVLYETLGKAWPRAKATQLQFEAPVLAECLQTLELSPRDVQVLFSTYLVIIGLMYTLTSMAGARWLIVFTVYAKVALVVQ